MPDVREVIVPDVKGRNGALCKVKYGKINLKKICGVLDSIYNH